eukprot:Blabericola_migrator_1__5464@NODE_2792_length_2346_cov_833_905222_g1751_i0_p2_GENE_NODE_2792_length_2346_cov_833_905222_g1751_i0NODE_2792_length_2346_cov_833_905222_g1751_i0_p2_ORF_typecomplete_len235_score44_67Proteasome/PF00227_26/1_3e22_NODE_2792_length_2346_cov_833_905222_g1751_i060764
MVAASVMFEAGIQDPQGGPAPPSIVGASVIAAKYADGVMVASFTSIASAKQYLNIDRIHLIGEGCLVAAAGNHPDYQEALHNLSSIELEDSLWLRAKPKTPFEWTNYMRSYLYSQRNEMQPNWLHMLFAGVHEEKPYLSLVDVYGTAIEGDFFCPGLGQYYSIPSLRKNWRPDLSESECRALLTSAMRTMIAYLKPVTSQIQFARITKQGAVIESPTSLRQRWHPTYMDADSVN